jgi:hypothetical protein
MARDHFIDEVLERRERIQKELVAIYRTQKLDFGVLVGKLGEITMTYDILSKFEKDINRAQNTEKKLYDTRSST